jgi:hypothetical protein
MSKLCRRHDLNFTSVVDSLTAGAGPVTPWIQREMLIFCRQRVDEATDPSSRAAAGAILFISDGLKSHSY